MTESHDPLRPHRHDPNYEVPPGDGAFRLEWPDGTEQEISVAQLACLPHTVIEGCTIVSTGHGSSGPFAFGGVRLIDLVEELIGAGARWHEIEVISGDGFGNRIFRDELRVDETRFPLLLAYEKDGAPLTRADGLVRLIVPIETDDALRQVKWVARVRLV